MKNNSYSIYLKALKKFVKEKTVSKARDIVDEIHPGDLVPFLQKWKLEEILDLFRILSNTQTGMLLSHFDDEFQEKILSSLNEKEIKQIFNKIDTDELVDIIDDINPELQKKVLMTTNLKERKLISKQLHLEKHKVGYHMHHEYISLPLNVDIKTAKQLIKDDIKFKKKEIAGDIFVIDKNKKLKGFVLIEDLIVQKDNVKFTSLVKTSTSLKMDDNIQNAIDLIKKYDIPTIPVVDKNNVLVGVIEAADIIDHIQEDYDNLSKSSGATVVKKTQIENKSYLEQTVFEMFKSRFKWLLLLFAIGTITQLAITGFQFLWASSDLYGWGNAVSSVTWTIIISFSFSSVLTLISSVNDSTSSSSTMTTSTLKRSLAIGEIKPKDYKKVYSKELKLSLLVGLMIGLSSILRTYFVWACYGVMWQTGMTGQMQLYLLIVTLASAFAFFIGIVVGNMFGTFIPLYAKKHNKEGKFFTSGVSIAMTDIISIVLFLSIISAILIPVAQTLV